MSNLGRQFKDYKFSITDNPEDKSKTLRGYHKGDWVGLVDYKPNKRGIKVEYISSPFSGEGHAQAMMHHIYQQHPESEINWGNTLNAASTHLADKFDKMYGRTKRRKK